MPETLRKVSSSLQDEMRERISTFETVLNVDQFLVRLLVSVGWGGDAVLGGNPLPLTCLGACLHW